MSAPKLSLGPILFNWSAERKNDFYARIADEAPIDIVHLGEVVCPKRAPFYDPELPAVIERLQRAGKEVVLSTYALILDDRDLEAVRGHCAVDEVGLEANDIATVGMLAGRPHAVGPFLNIYNAGTAQFLADNGATRLCLPCELSKDAMTTIATELGDAVAVEAQIFGRAPLAISARCYHARAHGLQKDSCRYVCGEDLDGKPVDTLDGEAFLAINGLQTLSHHYLELSDVVADLRAGGVSVFRLSPHACDMVAVASHYRQLLDGGLEAEVVRSAIADLIAPEEIANGYAHGTVGAALVA